MKTKGITIFLAIVFLLSACTPKSLISASPTEEEIDVLTTQAASIETETIIETETSPEKIYPLFETTMGDFIIVSARLVDEVRDTKAPPGDKFLLIELARPGMEKLIMGEFSLESFQTMITDNSDEIYVLGNDDSHLFSSGMGGWLNEDEFVMGYTVFQPIPETYTLYWMDNPPILLEIEE